jgi:hypothetical protein
LRHQAGYEGNIAGKTVELGYDCRALMAIMTLKHRTLSSVASPFIKIAREIAKPLE